MDVKEAVRMAKEYVGQLFADEGIKNVGLEEVVFDDAADEWKITIGFSRPWDRAVGTGTMTAVLGGARLERSYKVVRVDDSNGKVKKLITDRILKFSN